MGCVWKEILGKKDLQLARKGGGERQGKRGFKVFGSSQRVLIEIC